MSVGGRNLLVALVLVWRGDGVGGGWGDGGGKGFVCFGDGATPGTGGERESVTVFAVSGYKVPRWMEEAGQWQKMGQWQWQREDVVSERRGRGVGRTLEVASRSHTSRYPRM